MNTRERPILFSGAMVRAILEGRKTQTRRVVKSNTAIAAIGSGDDWHRQKAHPAMGTPWLVLLDDDGMAFSLRCPYGKPGDRLWVRETWMDLLGTGIERTTGDHSRYAYRADTLAGSYGDEARKDYGLKWRPSIHMPRWASRVTLGITGVRVERLWEISLDDVQSEGCPFPPQTGDAADWYRQLWEQINGLGSWNANPWVWVIEFKKDKA